MPDTYKGYIMGFLGNMMDEAGTKTGKAIGNKLFGRYADDVRIGYGETGNDAKAQVEAESEARRLEMEQQHSHEAKVAIKEQVREVQSAMFDSQNVDANINLLMQLSSLIESIDDDDWSQAELLRAAKSKFKTGLDLCKVISPSHPAVVMFTNRQQEIADQKAEIANQKTAMEKKAKKETVRGVIIAIAVFAALIAGIAILIATE